MQLVAQFLELMHGGRVCVHTLSTGALNLDGKGQAG